VERLYRLTFDDNDDDDDDENDSYCYLVVNTTPEIEAGVPPPVGYLYSLIQRILMSLS
jgi:hypothetical protein